MDGETVTITRYEYEQLQRDYSKLRALEGAGVDNWDGYDEAVKTLEE